jgi:CheY-like chemotaxis protein
VAILRRKRTEPEDPTVLAAEVGTVLRVLDNYPPGTALSFGAPTRCPTCGNFGLVLGLDGVDGGRSFNRCVSCAAQWMISARALRAARTAAPATSARSPFVVPALGDDRAASQGFTIESAPAGGVMEGAPSGVLFSRSSSGDVDRKVVNPGIPVPQPVGGWASSAAEKVTPIHRHDGPMRILLIEDDPFDVEVVRAILEPVGDDTIDLRTAGTRADGELAARSAAPDLVLLDLGLPDSHGLATVTKWHFNNAADAPVLVVSGAYGAEVVDRGREFGVSGFLDKAELADLLARGSEGTTMFLDRLTAAASG